MGTWATYGAGLWDAKPDQQDIQRVPTYRADVPRTNWLLGLVGLAALGYAAHRYLGKGRRK